jgi:ureidoacrylate peracid hydrolase
MAPEAGEKSALIVVDMQNDYCRSRGVYPRNALKCFDMESVVAATARAHASYVGFPVIYLRMAWNKDSSRFPIDAALVVEQSRPFVRTEGLRRGTWGVEVLEELPQPDYVVDKTRYSGFHNTGLEALLRGL